MLETFSNFFQIMEFFKNHFEDFNDIKNYSTKFKQLIDDSNPIISKAMQFNKMSRIEQDTFFVNAEIVKHLRYREYSELVEKIVASLIIVDKNELEITEIGEKGIHSSPDFKNQTRSKVNILQSNIEQRMQVIRQTISSISKSNPQDIFAFAFELRKMDSKDEAGTERQ